ncbi:choline dehydrogenase [Aspergillus sclerotiicarbonarius CBS 121057]|uniref:Choline dehydrogenase n=1 Tax=Aspergillus sclerotiicarbonarius (strain CBS 121057 / IBT 28362) TaxID=1448318 RepID=A0A319EJK0_ASPSB|nr:choline dehydrogenase [Aspergillus sclerotiicarbonarius CBS 121057]
MAKNGAHFDFVIVGGGTAGNTVAGRLAENPNVTILIVEAGIGNPQDIPEITTPSSAMDLRNSKYDWAYKTTMVKRDDYERVEKPNTRGKTLGGSSSLNYFTWVPGCKPTFDMWEEYGGKEWTWDPLLPYLRKSVTYHDDPGLYPSDLAKIGSGGPIHISHSELLDEMAPFREAVTKAWLSRGHGLTENIYDGTMIGLTHCCDTIYKGTRSGSFLFVQNKPNITILPQVHSKRLIIDDADRKCKGVTVIDPSGQELSFYANREVILSQGVFETPKLLMLSGIGPSRELAKHGIDTIVDSRHVGQHLIDHPGVPFVLRVKDGFGMEDHLLRKGPKNDAVVAAYQKDRSGPVGSGLLELVGFPRIDDYLEKDEEYRRAKAANGGKDPFCPDGQPHFELDFVCMFGSAFQWHYPTPKTGNYITIVVDLVRPVSEPGEVTLNSSDPLVQPNINLNFFADDLDIIAMREGIRFTYDVLTKGDGFKDLVEAEYPWEMPLHSDAEMHRAVLDRCQTAFHPCGTARLSKSIEQGVVDPQLRVHGIKQLRVADASVVPVIPDCRIQNSIYMVGEKCADMIKAAHPDLYQ